MHFHVLPNLFLEYRVHHPLISCPDINKFERYGLKSINNLMGYKGNLRDIFLGHFNLMIP